MCGAAGRGVVIRNLVVTPGWLKNCGNRKRSSTPCRASGAKAVKLPRKALGERERLEALRIRGSRDGHPLLPTPPRGAHLTALGRSSRILTRAKAAHIRAWGQAWRAGGGGDKRHRDEGCGCGQEFPYCPGSKAGGWGCFPRRLS